MRRRKSLQIAAAIKFVRRVPLSGKDGASVQVDGLGSTEASPPALSWPCQAQRCGQVLDTFNNTRPTLASVVGTMTLALENFSIQLELARAAAMREKRSNSHTSLSPKLSQAVEYTSRLIVVLSNVEPATRRPGVLQFRHVRGCRCCSTQTTPCWTALTYKRHMHHVCTLLPQQASLHMQHCDASSSACHSNQRRLARTRLASHASSLLLLSSRITLCLRTALLSALLGCSRLVTPAR